MKFSGLSVVKAELCSWKLIDVFETVPKYLADLCESLAVMHMASVPNVGQWTMEKSLPCG